MKIRFEGVEKTVSNLNLCVQRLKKTKKSAQSDASIFGKEVVLSKVPMGSGNIADGITNIDTDAFSEVISMPSLDPEDTREKQITITRGSRSFTITDPGKPNLNVLLETGDVDALNWKPFGVSQPNNGREFHFMENSVPQTREEFIRLLNVGVQEATR